jgi:outer membrane protein
MRVLRLLMVLGAVTLLAAGPALAQTPPAGQKPPATTPAPAPAPAAQTPPAPAPAAPRPYPEGAKIAYVDMQGIAAGSNEGKAFSNRIADLQKKKTAELTEKNKALDSARAKQNSSGLMNDSARLALEKDIDRLTREVQFAQQEAQSELQALQAELQVDFQKKVGPIVEQVAKEKGLHFLIDIGSSGAVWWDTGLDLTAEIIKRLDASTAKK